METLTGTGIDMPSTMVDASPRRMIYLASPYSHPDAAVRERRFQAVCRAAVELIRQGRIVYAPIVHGHPLTLCGLPGAWSFWKAADIGFLLVAEELVVLRLPGWDQSHGVREEIDLAESAGKPVHYVDPVPSSPPWAPVATEAAR